MWGQLEIIKRRDPNFGHLLFVLTSHLTRHFNQSKCLVISLKIVVKFPHLYPVLCSVF